MRSLEYGGAGVVYYGCPSAKYRLRLGSVRLRSRALDLRFSCALAAVLVPRPPLCPSPRAHSRGPAPPPSRATLNCARFAGSCGDGETKKALLRNQTTSSFLFFVASTFAIPPGDNYLIRTAVISACRLASISLPSLGHAVATAFLLSTTSLVGLPLASSTPSAISSL